MDSISLVFTNPRSWLLNHSAATLGGAVADLAALLPQLEDDHLAKEVPLLNHTPYQEVAALSGRLVSFTAMVQDTSLAPQIFPLRFTTPQPSTTATATSRQGNESSGSGLFLDHLPASILDPRTRITHYGDRQPVYLVTVPDAGHKVSADRAFPNAPASKFPIPGQPHQACVAKYYPASTRLAGNADAETPAASSTMDVPALGSVVTITGILEFNPAEEQQVPTIHVLLSSPATTPTSDTPWPADLSLADVRSAVIAHVAARFLHNDELAAQLLFLHLTNPAPVTPSTSAAAADDELSWPHSLPLTLVVPSSETWIGSPDWLAQLSRTLGIPTAGVSLTQATLSSTSFAPRALALDDDNNDAAAAEQEQQEGIHAGQLQLATSSLLVVSDRDLEPGQLGDTAVRNLQVLHKVLATHVLPYVFPYTQVHVPAAYAKVVITDALGGEVVPRGVRVVVAPREASADPREGAAEDWVQPYVAHVRHAPACKMPAVAEDADGVQAAVEAAYVADRRQANDATAAPVAMEGPEALDGPAGPAQLHWQLALARRVGRSLGRDTVRVDDWEAARQLDAVRKQRVRAVMEGYKQVGSKASEEPRR